MYPLQLWLMMDCMYPLKLWAMMDCMLALQLWTTMDCVYPFSCESWWTVCTLSPVSHDVPCMSSWAVSHVGLCVTPSSVSHELCVPPLTVSHDWLCVPLWVVSPNSPSLITLSQVLVPQRERYLTQEANNTATVPRVSLCSRGMEQLSLW